MGTVHHWPSADKMSGGSFFAFFVLLGVALGADRPHVVFFLMDDMGFGDVPWNNDYEGISMPHLEALRDSSLILDYNYVGPVCSPTRGSLMTGKYMYKIGQNHGVYYPDHKECLFLSEETIADKLKSMGYATHLIGKWHLGFCDESCVPTSRGFDSFFGFYGSHINHYKHDFWGGYDWWFNGEYMNENGTWAPHRMNDRAAEIVAAHDPDQPLYMYYASGLIHSPLQSPPGFEYLDDSDPANDRAIIKQMITDGDAQVGHLVNILKEKGMYDDTIFIFSSDNGGQENRGNNYPLRGFKSSIYEGGVRVPGVVHYPKGMDPSVQGTRTNEIMYVSDWFNTILSMVGGEQNPDLDSLDQSGMLLHGEPSVRTELVYNLDNAYPQPYGQSAIRMGDYKLIVGYPGDLDGCSEGPDGANMNDPRVRVQGHGEFSYWYDMYGINTESGNNYPDMTDGVEYNLDASSDGTSRKKRFGVPHHEKDMRTKYSQDAKHRVVLYNVVEDPSETTDLAGDMPEKVQEMGARLAELWQNMPFNSIELEADPAAARDPRFNGIWSPGWCPDIAQHDPNVNPDCCWGHH